MVGKRIGWLLYGWIIVGLALAIWALHLPALRHLDPAPFLLFLGLALVAEWQAARLSPQVGIIYGLVVALPATALFGAIPGATLGALANLVRRFARPLVRERRLPSPLVTFFAAAQLFLAYALAGATYHRIIPPSSPAPPPPSLPFWPTVGAYFLALVVFKALNTLLVDQLYTRIGGQYQAEAFIHTLAVEGAIHLSTAPLGLLILLAYPAYGLPGVVLSFTPVLIASYAIQRYLQGEQMTRLLKKRADQLAHILQFSEAIRTDVDLDRLLSQVAQAVRERLGFHTVLVSTYDKEADCFVRRASTGIPQEDWARLQEQHVPGQEILQFFDDRFRIGRCYLIRSESNLLPKQYAYVPSTTDPAGPDAWHPKDLLLVPLIGHRGDLVGIISVDEPVGGRRPQPETLYALEIFANQAAQAIENVELYHELRHRLLSLEEANRRIQQAQQELARYSRGLEGRVAQRTHELRERTQQLEEALERATESDRLKSEFLANMSHELRTPLNSIIGFSRVILKGIDGPITDLQRTDLTAIYNSGIHLLSLINDILDLSKIEAGRLELNKEAVDLGPVVKGVLDTCAPLVQDKPVLLQDKVPTDLSQVYADPTRVRQIILNLVSNAIKFTDRGSVTVGARQEGADVIVSINDTGVGIDPKNIEAVFEPFRQVARKMERRTAGTGLGLAISQRFVEMHGGRIWVESEPGQGSTFFFTLPIIGAAMDTEPLRAEEPVPAPPGRPILVVDDDPDVIALFRRYLEAEGYQVIGATDAVEALRLAWQVQPCAITLDIILPEEDGWAVLRALKEDRASQDIPVIICSVLQEENTGFSLGAVDYLTKPISQEDLLAALNRLWKPVRRIVVIEDQPEERALITRVLEQQGGYEVLPVVTGEEGLATIQEHLPELIILDLLLPGLDGFDVLARLKQDPRTRAIPVIVVTAKSLTAEDQARLEGQMAALLHKGLLQMDDLLAEVARVLHEAVPSQPGPTAPSSSPPSPAADDEERGAR